MLLALHLNFIFQQQHFTLVLDCDLSNFINNARDTFDLLFGERFWQTLCDLSIIALLFFIPRYVSG